MDEPRGMQIETVFCAFDFSDTAESALEQAMRFARRHRGRLILAHAVEPIPLGPYPAIMSPHDELEIVNIARKRIEGLADSLRKAGMTVEVKVEQGQPGAQLISMAEETGADLIVIGTRGLTGFNRLAMGSTAEHVVRCSKCPVLTVHPEDRLLRASIDTVIIPTDLSPNAKEAVEAFISLFGQWERPQVFLVYADETPPYLDLFEHERLRRAQQQDVMREEIERQLAPIAELLRAADFEVEFSVMDGDPVSVTTELARECDADLILLSTHGRSALVNALLGRTAQRIVQHAKCPVLTVRPEGGNPDS